MGHLHPALKVPRVLQLKAPTAYPRTPTEPHPAFLTVPLSTILVFTLRRRAGKKEPLRLGIAISSRFLSPLFFTLTVFRKASERSGYKIAL